MEIYDTRSALETVGAQRAAENIRRNPALKLQLDETVAAIEAAARKQDRALINRADLALHTQIYALSESPLLQTLWTAMARHVLIMFGITTFRRTDFDFIIEEHRRLRRVLEKGDPQEIASEVMAHIIGPHRSREEAAEHWSGQAKGAVQSYNNREGNIR